MNMNIRHMARSAAAGLLALVGCQSGMYSTDISVERRAGGISDYTVEPSLDVKEFPASMPVVVESKSTTEKGDHAVNNLLWLVTLGVVPGVTSEATVYDVTVRTPLGERSGTCTVEASSWFGWLPIFLPYPGIADERAADPKLPNAALAKKARDRLVENLVSQFSKEEYASYAAKNNSPEMKAKRVQEAAERERVAKERAEAERVRLAKEAADRAEKKRLAVCEVLYEITVKRDLSQIRKCYSRGEQYLNPFLGEKKEKKRRWERNQLGTSDWLARWASPRLPLAEADAQAGEAILSEFGAKFLPNAYANYEKMREALAEIQQVFNEEFPQPWTIKKYDPRWNSFNKVLERFVQTRTEAFLCHDELCHYWLLWRLGVLSDKDLASVDKPRLSAYLLSENIEHAEYALVSSKTMEEEIAAFAVKYAPKVNGVYQKMERELKELDALLSEVSRQRRQMDDVRYSRALAAAVDKRNALASELNALLVNLQTWRMDHRTMEKSSDDVARCDAEMDREAERFLRSCSRYVTKDLLSPVTVIADAELVAIPGRRYRMQRTEVTQWQWRAVMGTNPSRSRGLDSRPVENVSWNDCQDFIRLASVLDGRRYRLPTEKEWEYACRAGGRKQDVSEIDFGRRANGECGPLDVMGWYKRNSGRPRSVAQKEPNAWGLYDMHGNVWEWCQNLYSNDASKRVCMGGSADDYEWHCTATATNVGGADDRSDYIGFRLAVSED